MSAIHWGGASLYVIDFVKGELYVFAIIFTCSSFSFSSYTTFLMKYKKGEKDYGKLIWLFNESMR